MINMIVDKVLTIVLVVEWMICLIMLIRSILR